MWMPLTGIIIGLTIGLLFPLSIPVAITNFMSIIALCSIDSIFIGFRAKLSNKFDTLLFTNEFILNSILATVLVYLGNIMNTNMFIAVAIIFTARIFYNLSSINQYLFLRKKELN